MWKREGGQDSRLDADEGFEELPSQPRESGERVHQGVADGTNRVAVALKDGGQHAGRELIEAGVLVTNAGVGGKSGAKICIGVLVVREAIGECNCIHQGKICSLTELRTHGVRGITNDNRAAGPAGVEADIEVGSRGDIVP